MSQQNLETVKRLFDTVRRRDQAALQEVYHPEIVIHEAPSLPYGGDYHGHEGALQHVNGYYQTWDAFRPTAWRAYPPIFLETTEDYAVVLWREEAVAPGSGRRIDLPALGVYQVRDGQVVESRMFQETAAVRDLLKDAQQQTASTSLLLVRERDGQRTAPHCKSVLGDTEVELKPFNDRALNRHLKMLCAKMVHEQPRLPDGRCLLFKVQEASLPNLAAQERAVPSQEVDTR